MKTQAISNETKNLKENLTIESIRLRVFDAKVKAVGILNSLLASGLDKDKSPNSNYSTAYGIYSEILKLEDGSNKNGNGTLADMGKKNGNGTLFDMDKKLSEMETKIEDLMKKVAMEKFSSKKKD